MQALLQNGNTELWLNSISKQEHFLLKYNLHLLLEWSRRLQTERFQSHSQCTQQLATCVTPSPTKSTSGQRTVKAMAHVEPLKSYSSSRFLYFGSLLYRIWKPSGPTRKSSMWSSPPSPQECDAPAHLLSARPLQGPGVLSTCTWGGAAVPARKGPD